MENFKISLTNEELAVKNVWKNVQDDEDFCKYFPNINMEKDFHDRKYFWGVALTIRKEWA